MKKSTMKKSPRSPFGASIAALLILSMLCVASCALQAADTATITYRRVFKGSSPEFIEIKLSDSGTASSDIRQLSEDADPEPFQISAGVREKVFALAAALHDFQGADLDVHRRIADLGEKTFRYEKGATVYETHFNYTINHDATQLVSIFEGLAQQQQDAAM